MIVVPDAGPLIYLACAGKLELLAKLYDRVIVPLVVYEEIVVAGTGLVGSAEVSASRWLEVEDAAPDPVLARTLDRGEAAANRSPSVSAPCFCATTPAAAPRPADGACASSGRSACFGWQRTDGSWTASALWSRRCG